MVHDLANGFMSYHGHIMVISWSTRVSWMICAAFSAGSSLVEFSWCSHQRGKSDLFSCHNLDKTADETYRTPSYLIIKHFPERKHHHSYIFHHIFQKITGKEEEQQPATPPEKGYSASSVHAMLTTFAHVLLWLVLAREGSPVLDHTLSRLSSSLYPKAWWVCSAHVCMGSWMFLAPHPTPAPDMVSVYCVCVCVCAWKHERYSHPTPPQPYPDRQTCLYRWVKFECVWVRRWVPEPQSASEQEPCILDEVITAIPDITAYVLETVGADIRSDKVTLVEGAEDSFFLGGMGRNLCAFHACPA